MSSPIAVHADGSDCYTHGCRLQVSSLLDSAVKNNDFEAFLCASLDAEKVKVNPFVQAVKPVRSSGKTAPKVFRSLEYGTSDYVLFKNKAEESESTLTAAEYQSVMEYTGWAYKQYYTYLEGTDRNGKTLGEGLNDADKEKLLRVIKNGCDNIDSFIRKSGVLKDPVTVFRGEKPPRGVSVEEHIKNTYRVGDKVEVKRYLSTSMDAKIASEIVGDTPESYVLVIRTKEGVMLGDNVSEHGLREKEVILPRDRSFTVDKVSKDFIQWGQTRKEHVTVYLTMD